MLPCSKYQYLNDENLIEDSIEEHEYKDWKLTVCEYKTEPGFIEHSRGILEYTKALNIKNEIYNITIADIFRNYSHFWFKFIEHSNGRNYLLCGHDYQGITIIELETMHRTDYLNKGYTGGFGFCPVDAEYDIDNNALKINGCIWGAEFEIITFDFSNPMHMPWKQIDRVFEDEELNIPVDEEERLRKEEIDREKLEGKYNIFSD